MECSIVFVVFRITVGPFAKEHLNNVFHSFKPKMINSMRECTIPFIAKFTKRHNIMQCCHTFVILSIHVCTSVDEKFGENLIIWKLNCFFFVESFETKIDFRHKNDNWITVIQCEKKRRIAIIVSGIYIGTFVE